MSTISLPKLSSQFLVTTPGKPELAIIGAQTIALDLGSELLTAATPTHRTNRVILWVEDDIASTLMRAIRAQQAAQAEDATKIACQFAEHGARESDFQLVVSLLNGSPDSVVEEYAFDGCRLEALQHSLLTYEEADSKVKLAIKRTKPAMPQYDIVDVEPLHLEASGVIRSSGTRLTSVKLLQLSFSAMHHLIKGSPWSPL